MSDSPVLQGSSKQQRYESLVAQLYQDVYRFAYWICKNQTLAEDLVQDTFVKALRARGQYQADTNLKAWLLRILRNTFINRYHRGSLERAVVANPVADPVSDGWVSSATMRATRDAETMALKPELARHICRAIDELPEEFREHDLFF